jgi:hypothetical protein
MFPKSWAYSWPRRHEPAHLRGWTRRRIVVVWCNAPADEQSEGDEPRR